MNYKRLACYEHCPGTFGYTFVCKNILHKGDNDDDDNNNNKYNCIIIHFTSVVKKLIFVMRGQIVQDATLFIALHFPFEYQPWR